MGDTVTIVRYEWRNWDSESEAFTSREAAEQSVIDNAFEWVDDYQREEGFNAAVEALIAQGHSVYVDDVEVVR